MSRDLQRYFRLKVTQLEMLRDRGYQIGKEERFLEPGGFGQFVEYLNTDEDPEDLMSKKYKKDDDIVKVIYTKIYETTKTNKQGETIVDFRGVNLNDAKAILAQLSKENFNHAIIISHQPIKGQALALLKDSRYPMMTIELFSHDDLGFNVTKHYLVPPHRLLTSEEMDQIFQENKALIAKLPGIDLKDPVSRYFGAKEGQVFMVRRFDVAINTLVPNYIAFRRVENVVPMFNSVSK